MTITMKKHEHEDIKYIFCTESTWELVDADEKQAFICYNGTSTIYICVEDHIDDAFDTFADNNAFDTQGPLDQTDIDEFYEEFPDDGPAAGGYFIAGNANEWFNGCYLRVLEVKVSLKAEITEM